TVRTRPAAGAGSTVAEAASALPGLEVSAALRVRSFWLIGLAQFSFAFAASGTNLHAIPYFMGIGYGAARAALLMSLVLGMAGAGKLGMGLLADRIGARRALVLNFVLCTGGMVSLLFAANAAAAAIFRGRAPPSRAHEESSHAGVPALHRRRVLGRRGREDRRLDQPRDRGALGAHRARGPQGHAARHRGRPPGLRRGPLAAHEP